MTHPASAVQVQFLGSGDAFGSGGRLQSCILVGHPGGRFLIDCGASAMISLRRFGVDPNSIDGIFLTHLHGDHYGGLPFFILDAQLVSRRAAPLLVAGPPGLCGRLPAAMETLFPGSQDSANFGGKQLGVNIAYTVSGIWYSKPAFEKAGYTYPKTWAEMLDLCERIKKEGKAAPWTYQGKYPYYIWGIVLNMLIYYSAGTEALIQLDNLEPNAWKNPDVVRAVEDLYLLWDRGYIMPGTAGLTHTESQTEWLKGNAVFLPCGNWLENEMKTVTPEGFDMVVANVPGYADGKGAQNDVNANGGETYIVPSKAKNVKHGMEYLRCLLSKDSAKFFAENVSAIMPVIGGTEGAKLSEAVKSAVALAQGGNPVIWNLPNWYSSISKDLETKTGELMTGVIKPADFIEAMQKSADAVAADPDITKFKREK